MIREWTWDWVTGIAGMIEGDDCRIPDGTARAIEITRKACEKAAPTAGMDADLLVCPTCSSIGDDVSIAVNGQCSDCMCADEDEDEPYDDSQDHDPCPECAHTKYPGKDVVNPCLACPRCDGSQWI